MHKEKHRKIIGGERHVKIMGKNNRIKRKHRTARLKTVLGGMKDVRRREAVAARVAEKKKRS